MHPALDPETIRPLTRIDYAVLNQQGAFERERVELVRGMLVHMTPIDAAHNRAVERLNEILILGVRERARVRRQPAFPASEHSETQPDLLVYSTKQAFITPSETQFVAEVADSSLRFDREVKALLYAAARVPEYWIVNIPERCIEVYRDPHEAAYTSKTVHAVGDTVTMRNFPDVQVAVSDVLG
jgi:Uma2 family endonuclease